MSENDINNGMDIIELAWVRGRIRELEEIIKKCVSLLDLTVKNVCLEEATVLHGIIEACQGCAGDRLIRDGHFRDYCVLEAYNDGDVRMGSLVDNCVDWELCARIRRRDYKAVDFRRVTYWIRK